MLQLFIERWLDKVRKRYACYLPSKDFLWASYYNCLVLPNINQNKDFMSGHVIPIYTSHDFRFGTDEIGTHEIGEDEIWTIYSGYPKFHSSQFYPHQAEYWT